MTNPNPEPIRKSSLPTIPPSEWEFFTWFPHPDGGGDMVRGQRQRGVQVRRRVSYSDWEPVRPDRWADEPESGARAAAPAARMSVGEAEAALAPLEAAVRAGREAQQTGDRAALRDRIAAAIREFPFDDFGLDDVSYLLESDPATQEWVPKLADAVLLVVLSAPTDQAAVRAAALREAALHLYTALFPAVYADMGQKAAEGVNRAVSELRRLADDGPAAAPAIVEQVVAALQAKAQALSVEAEEEMRRDLEEQAQVWHEAADLARRTARKASRNTQPPAEPAGPAAPAKETQLCGKTRGIGGATYRPCARPAEHPEAYCQSADGAHLFLAAPPMDPVHILGVEADEPGAAG